MKVTACCHINDHNPDIALKPLQCSTPGLHTLQIGHDLSVFCTQEQALQIAQVILEAAAGTGAAGGGRMSKVLDNPMISIHRQAFEPRISQLAEVQRQIDRGMAESLRETFEEIEGQIHFLTVLDALWSNPEFEPMIASAKEFMRQFEKIIVGMEAV